MELIAQTFDAGYLARGHAGHDDPRPLFVVGLPRSGTTLVDRILGSHPQVASRGESTDLAQAIVRLAGPADSKAQLRSEEHTSELQSLMRISYAVFCLKKKK